VYKLFEMYSDSLIILSFLKQVEGITNEMANYLTMALDPNSANLYKMMVGQIENYNQRIDKLQEELETILKSKNITIVELFHRIAMR
jgi:hypothetical protein